MRNEVQIAILGTLQVTTGPTNHSVPSGKLSTLLTALAIDCGAAVSQDRLIDVIWGEQPPASASTTLRGHVKRLRSLLNTVSGGRGLIRRSAAGYVLATSPGAVDLHRFRALRNGASSCRDSEQERQLLAQALGLWRGQALSGIDSDVLDQEVRVPLDEERLQALHRKLELELDVGHPAVVVPAAHEILGQNPLHERIWVLLLRALAATGRYAEALQQYERARGVLRDSLGTAPGSELRALHRELLAEATSLALPCPRPTPQSSSPGEAASAANGIRSQLPPTAARFVGRAAELSDLQTVLADRARPAPSVVVVTGPAGIGKSALAVHAARGSLPSYPDGVLYVDLHGFDPTISLTTTDAALVSLLRGIDVPDADIPSATQDKSALLRAATANLRLLLVVDDAHTSDHVRPLLLNSPCRTVVTSRRQMRSLVTKEGAVRIEVEPLTPGESTELLASGLGRERVAAEPVATAEVVRACSGLPLALRMVVEQVERCPFTGLSEVSAVLRSTDGRLDALEIRGDDAAGFRALMSRSCASLALDELQLFRALGRRDSCTVEVNVAARLIGRPTRCAGRLLDGLASNSLVRRTGTSTYEIASLVHSYASEIADLTDWNDGGRRVG